MALSDNEHVDPAAVAVAAELMLEASNYASPWSHDFAQIEMLMSQHLPDLAEFGDVGSIRLIHAYWYGRTLHGGNFGLVVRVGMRLMMLAEASRTRYPQLAHGPSALPALILQAIRSAVGTDIFDTEPTDWLAQFAELVDEVGRNQANIDDMLDQWRLLGQLHLRMHDWTGRSLSAWRSDGSLLTRLFGTDESRLTFRLYALNLTFFDPPHRISVDTIRVVYALMSRMFDWLPKLKTGPDLPIGEAANSLVHFLAEMLAAGEQDVRVGIADLVDAIVTNDAYPHISSLEMFRNWIAWARRGLRPGQELTIQALAESLRRETEHDVHGNRAQRPPRGGGPYTLDPFRRVTTLPAQRPPISHPYVLDRSRVLVPAQYHTAAHDRTNPPQQIVYRRNNHPHYSTARLLGQRLRLTPGDNGEIRVTRFTLLVYAHGNGNPQDIRNQFLDLQHLVDQIVNFQHFLPEPETQSQLQFNVILVPSHDLANREVRLYAYGSNGLYPASESHWSAGQGSLADLHEIGHAIGLDHPGGMNGSTLGWMFPGTIMESPWWFLPSGQPTTADTRPVPAPGRGLSPEDLLSLATMANTYLTTPWDQVPVHATDPMPRDAVRVAPPSTPRTGRATPIVVSAELTRLFRRIPPTAETRRRRLLTVADLPYLEQLDYAGALFGYRRVKSVQVAYTGLLLRLGRELYGPSIGAELGVARLRRLHLLVRVMHPQLRGSRREDVPTAAEVRRFVGTEFNVGTAPSAQQIDSYAMTLDPETVRRVVTLDGDALSDRGSNIPRQWATRWIAALRRTPSRDAVSPREMLLAATAVRLIDELFPGWPPMPAWWVRNLVRMAGSMPLTTSREVMRLVPGLPEWAVEPADIYAAVAVIDLLSPQTPISRLTIAQVAHAMLSTDPSAAPDAAREADYQQGVLGNSPGPMRMWILALVITGRHKRFGSDTTGELPLHAGFFAPMLTADNFSVPAQNALEAALYVRYATSGNPFGHTGLAFSAQLRAGIFLRHVARAIPSPDRQGNAARATTPLRLDELARRYHHGLGLGEPNRQQINSLLQDITRYADALSLVDPDGGTTLDLVGLLEFYHLLTIARASHPRGGELTSAELAHHVVEQMGGPISNHPDPAQRTQDDLATADIAYGVARKFDPDLSRLTPTLLRAYANIWYWALEIDPEEDFTTGDDFAITVWQIVRQGLFPELSPTGAEDVPALVELMVRYRDFVDFRSLAEMRQLVAGVVDLQGMELVLEWLADTSTDPTRTRRDRPRLPRPVPDHHDGFDEPPRPEQQLTNGHPSAVPFGYLEPAAAPPGGTVEDNPPQSAAALGPQPPSIPTSLTGAWRLFEQWPVVDAMTYGVAPREVVAGQTPQEVVAAWLAEQHVASAGDQGGPVTSVSERPITRFPDLVHVVYAPGLARQRPQGVHIEDMPPPFGMVSLDHARGRLIATLMETPHSPVTPASGPWVLVSSVPAGRVLDSAAVQRFVAEYVAAYVATAQANGTEPDSELRGHIQALTWLRDHATLDQDADQTVRGWLAGLLGTAPNPGTFTTDIDEMVTTFTRIPTPVTPPEPAPPDQTPRQPSIPTSVVSEKTAADAVWSAIAEQAGRRLQQAWRAAELPGPVPHVWQPRQVRQLIAARWQVWSANHPDDTDITTLLGTPEGLVRLGPEVAATVLARALQIGVTLLDQHGHPIAIGAPDIIVSAGEHLTLPWPGTAEPQQIPTQISDVLASYLRKPTMWSAPPADLVTALTQQLPALPRASHGAGVVYARQLPGLDKPDNATPMQPGRLLDQPLPVPATRTRPSAAEASAVFRIATPDVVLAIPTTNTTKPDTGGGPADRTVDSVIAPGRFIVTGVHTTDDDQTVIDVSQVAPEQYPYATPLAADAADPQPADAEPPAQITSVTLGPWQVRKTRSGFVGSHQQEAMRANFPRIPGGVGLFGLHADPEVSDLIAAEQPDGTAVFVPKADFAAWLKKTLPELGYRAAWLMMCGGQELGVELAELGVPVMFVNGLAMSTPQGLRTKPKAHDEHTGIIDTTEPEPGEPNVDWEVRTATGTVYIGDWREGIKHLVAQVGDATLITEELLDKINEAATGPTFAWLHQPTACDGQPDTRPRNTPGTLSGRVVRPS